jgi:endonuclease/exonuclease/phosphatase family metal-dependent hydrolase
MTSAERDSPPPSLRDELVVLTANLQQRSEPAHSPQMAVFARRVAELLPFAPDVLLLQEVGGRTSELVARLLRERTPYDYGVAIGPGDNIVQKTGASEEVIWDSAVVMNRSTTQPLGTGGVLTSRYDPVDGVPGGPARTKQHSYLAARKNEGGTPIALTSIHFVTSLRLAPKSLGFCYKQQWIKEITAFFETTYPFPDFVRVIAGDMNNPRCLGSPETVRCEEWPFWKTLTARAGYKDAIFAVHGNSNRALHRQARRGNRTAKPRIDYIFTNAAVIASSHDVTYGARAGDPGFYSDHAFLWARLRLPPVVSSGPARSG